MPALGNRVKRGEFLCGSVFVFGSFRRSGKGFSWVSLRPKSKVPAYDLPLEAIRGMSREKQRAVEKLFGSCGKPASGDGAATGSGVFGRLLEFRKSRMRQRRLDHFNGNEPIDMLRSTNLDARFNSARDVRHLHAAWTSPDMLSAA